MLFRVSARRLATKTLLGFLVALLVGLLFGIVWQALFFAALAILVWHFRKLWQLINWLWQKQSISPPEASGIWGDIFDALYHRIRKFRLKQKRLNERVRRFRDGAEALPDAAVVLGRELTIRWANKKSQQMIGIRYPADVGQRLDNLLRTPDFKDYIDVGDFSQACVLPSPMNAMQRLELRFMDYGQDQILLLVRDISQLHRMETMRRDFVANVSHELKTPLTVVRGYVEMIQSSPLAQDSQWKKAFVSIEGQVTRMDRLVQQLLVLSQIEANQTQDHHRSVNMKRLIDILMDEVKWLNQEKQHQITVDVDDRLVITGDESEIKSACLNLVTNAIAYTPAQGNIAIRWLVRKQCAEFSVKDDGPGIQQKDLQRITERFYRVDRSRSRHTGGSGLGLAIVKHILQHHQGELLVDSRWGSGSEFTMRFAQHHYVIEAENSVTA